MNEQPPLDGARLLLRLAWPTAAVLGLILILTMGLVAVAFLVSPSESIADLGGVISKASSISRVITLIIIVPSIVALTILDKIDGSAAAAALSAIAGYVFGTTVS